jgi:hypothetical protein
MIEQQQLPGTEWFKGDFSRSEHFAAGARAYREAREMSHPDEERIYGIRADPAVLHSTGRTVLSQQGTPQHMSPQLHASYQALHAGIEAQYEHLTKPESEGGMGISVEVTKEDPYATPMEMREDVRANKRLKVLATGSTGGHGTMTPEMNDKMRAIHDAFGHLATGRNFSRHGEEAAAQHHASMFPKEAHPALMSELRGQTAALIVGGDFPENRPYELEPWQTEAQPKLPEPPKRKPPGKQRTLF